MRGAAVAAPRGAPGQRTRARVRSSASGPGPGPGASSLLKYPDAAGRIFGRLQARPGPPRVSEKPETGTVYPGGGSKAGGRLRPLLELEGKQEEPGLGVPFAPASPARPRPVALEKGWGGVGVDSGGRATGGDAG